MGIFLYSNEYYYLELRINANTSALIKDKSVFNRKIPLLGIIS